MPSAVSVVVDSNAAENWIADELSHRLGFDVDRSALPVGDVCFRGTDVCLVVERKELKDLASSIEKKHWEQQRARMQPSPDDDPVPTRYALLVHGDKRLSMQELPVTKHGSRIVEKSLRSSMMRTQLAHNIPVFEAVGSGETVDVLLHLYKEAVKRGADLFSPQNPTQYERGSVVGGKRARDTMESKDVLSAMLCCVNGMSVKRAEQIVASFPSLSALVAASEEELADVQVDGRRIGPAIAAKICELF